MAKKKYGKPKIEKVRIVTEEAVLQNCKGAPGTAGPTGELIDGCTLIGGAPCVLSGS